MRVGSKPDKGTTSSHAKGLSEKGGKGQYTREDFKQKNGKIEFLKKLFPGLERGQQAEY